MPLSNRQYDAIKRGFDEKRLTAKRIYDERLEEVYKKCPDVKDIDCKIASQSVKRAKLAIAGDTNALQNLEADNMELSKLKRGHLVAAGFPADYLDTTFSCPKCRDTGFIGNEQCSCFKAALSSLVYLESNLQEVLQRENFSTFDITLFNNATDSKDPIQQITPRENMRRCVAKAKRYIETFDTEPGAGILLFGPTGTGKTFLLNCVAKELLDTAHSVQYYTAHSLFKLLEQYKFGSDEPYEERVSAEQLFDCDLLVIDDLGTELVNSFTRSALFDVINERGVRRRSIIISTNLDLTEIPSVYDERIYSRICKDYLFFRFFGEDLRMNV